MRVVKKSLERSNNRFVNRGQEQHRAIFAERFLRSYRLLHFIACRVLGDDERAPFAVQRCWRAASRNPPHFEYEGAFRSWLVRVLIDQALAILREKQGGKDTVAAVVNAVSVSDSTGRDKQRRSRQWKLMLSKSRVGIFARQIFQFLLSDVITF
jgi:DNA-directed RNA polymerase specialized sigma24 family protein